MTEINKEYEIFFKHHNEAKVTITDYSIARLPPLQYNFNLNPADLPNYKTVGIVRIELPEDTYVTLINNYGKFLKIVYQLHDPVIYEEYSKLMTLVELKR